MRTRKTTKKARVVLIDPASVALVTSPVEGVRTSGTAFCVRNTQSGAVFVTCRHVVLDLDSGSSELRVNGHPAVEMVNGDELGVDLAVLSVPSLKMVPELTLASTAVKEALRVQAVGFRHLHADHYFSCPVRGSIDRILTVRRQLARGGAASFRVAADAGYEVLPGMSGSPVCNEYGQALGVMAFASPDGRSGYALSLESLHELLPALLPGAPPLTTGLSDEARMLESSDIPAPPPLPRVRNEEDLQNGRFGGLANDGAVELTAELIRSVGKSYFLFDAIVRSVRADVQIAGPARFYLHDSYPKNMIQTRKPAENGSRRLEDVHSYGVFTLGCQVYCSDGLWHRVELDLAKWGKDVGLDPVFLTR